MGKIDYIKNKYPEDMDSCNITKILVLSDILDPYTIITFYE